MGKTFKQLHNDFKKYLDETDVSIFSYAETFKLMNCAIDEFFSWCFICKKKYKNMERAAIHNRKKHYVKLINFPSKEIN